MYVTNTTAGKREYRNKGTSMYRIYEVAKDSIFDNLRR